MVTQDEFIPLGELSPIGSSVTDLSNTSSISTSFDCSNVKTEVASSQSGFANLEEKRIQRRVFSTQYTRPLDPPAIAFSTKEGEAMFCEAKAGGTAFGSLKLIENFGMQRNLNFCGPATLCTVLNALRADPERPWKVIKGSNLRNKIIGFLETLVDGFCSTNVSELGGFCSMTMNLRESLVDGFCSTNISELGGFCSMTMNLRELSE
ncbi:unnamed protein product [Camellia sinensis]